MSYVPLQFFEPLYPPSRIAEFGNLMHKRQHASPSHTFFLTAAEDKAAG